jgi:hypothetical protein
MSQYNRDVKFGDLVLITGGKNSGRVGIVSKVGKSIVLVDIETPVGSNVFGTYEMKPSKVALLEQRGAFVQR